MAHDTQEAGGKRAEAYSWENKHAYFQPRRGNRVTLYADAHALAEPLPPIQLAGGRLWREGSCWDDLFAAITAAEHFIYITGTAFAMCMQCSSCNWVAASSPLEACSFRYDRGPCLRSLLSSVKARRTPCS